MAFGERKLNPLFCYRSITRLTAYGHVIAVRQHETVRIHANLVAGSSRLLTPASDSSLAASGSEGVSLSLVARRGHSHSAETPRGTDLVPPQVSSSAANAQPQQPTRVCPPGELSSTNLLWGNLAMDPIALCQRLIPTAVGPAGALICNENPLLPSPTIAGQASQAPKPHGKQRVQIQL